MPEYYIHARAKECSIVLFTKLYDQPSKEAAGKWFTKNNKGYNLVKVYGPGEYVTFMDNEHRVAERPKRNREVVKPTTRRRVR